MPKILQFCIDSKEVEAFGATTDKNSTRKSEIGPLQPEDEYQDKEREKELHMIMHAPDPICVRDFFGSSDGLAKRLAHWEFDVHGPVLHACHTKKSRYQVDYYFGRDRPPDCFKSRRCTPRDVLSLQACGWGHQQLIMLSCRISFVEEIKTADM